MSIINDIKNTEKWNDFLSYKINNSHITKNEEADIYNFIESSRYEYFYAQIISDNFPSDYPRKIVVNKEGVSKKRIVYSFSGDDNIILKFIAHCLSRYDYQFSRSCYSFRRNYGAKDAINHFKFNTSYSKKYCFKGDIQNYFNSIDIELLIDKLEFLKKDDIVIYNLFVNILREDKVYYNNTLITDNHGAMAGLPISPFFANVYLSEMDKYFESRKIPYFRYSDDILIFADTMEELNNYIEYFYLILDQHKLCINPSKVTITKPNECFEFLGISYNCGEIDLSANTLRKTKAKIKRKAEALRRWQRKKGLTTDKAAIGFIRAMNHKFYGNDDDNDFSWNRWFFPNITTDKSLKIIDEYMQEYIRYIITGRHYKGNYRITYDMLKELGYRNLVGEYYDFKKR